MIYCWMRRSLFRLVYTFVVLYQAEMNSSSVELSLNSAVLKANPTCQELYL